MLSLTPPSPNKEDVNRERDRRLEEGVLINLPRLPEPIKISGESNKELTILSSLNQRSEQVQGGFSTIYRDSKGNEVELDKIQLKSLFSMYMDFVESVSKKSWALKGMSPIPRDFTEDRYWDE